MRAQYAWLLAALSVTLAAGQSTDGAACDKTGYLYHYGGCQVLALEGRLDRCPAGCESFLQNLPEVCKSFLATLITPEAATMLEIFCGLDLGRHMPRSSIGPQFDACIKYVTTINYRNQKITCAAALQRGTASCPDACSRWLRDIPSDCFQNITQIWSDEDISFLSYTCNIDWQRGFPQPNEPSPSPDEPSQSPDEDNTHNFTCAGDYSWIPLNTDQANQLGIHDYDSDAAVAGNCSHLYVRVDGYLEYSGCCSETLIGLFTWWQYDLGSAMQVKGVRLTPPHDDICCTSPNSDCIAIGPCYNRLAQASITVSNLSMYEFYNSQKYRDLVTSAGASDTLAGPGLSAAYLMESGKCNQVKAEDLVDADNKVVDSIDIGCEIGSGTDSAPTSIKGRYVTISRTTASLQTLALCGIEICAKAE